MSCFFPISVLSFSSSQHESLGQSHGDGHIISAIADHFAQNKRQKARWLVTVAALASFPHRPFHRCVDKLSCDIFLSTHAVLMVMFFILIRISRQFLFFGEL